MVKWRRRVSHEENSQKEGERHDKDERLLRVGRARHEESFLAPGPRSLRQGRLSWSGSCTPCFVTTSTLTRSYLCSPLQGRASRTSRGECYP